MKRSRAKRKDDKRRELITRSIRRKRKFVRFDPNRVTFTFNGQVLRGFHDGTFIEVAATRDHAPRQATISIGHHVRDLDVAEAMHETPMSYGTRVHQEAEATITREWTFDLEQTELRTNHASVWLAEVYQPQLPPDSSPAYVTRVYLNMLVHHGVAFTRGRDGTVLVPPGSERRLTDAELEDMFLVIEREIMRVSEAPLPETRRGRATRRRKGELAALGRWHPMIADELNRRRTIVVSKGERGTVHYRPGSISYTDGI